MDSEKKEKTFPDPRLKFVKCEVDRSMRVFMLDASHCISQIIIKDIGT